MKFDLCCLLWMLEISQFDQHASIFFFFCHLWFYLATKFEHTNTPKCTILPAFIWMNPNKPDLFLSIWKRQKLRPHLQFSFWFMKVSKSGLFKGKHKRTTGNMISSPCFLRSPKPNPNDLFCCVCDYNNLEENLIHKPLSVMNSNFCDPFSGSLRPLWLWRTELAQFSPFLATEIEPNSSSADTGNLFDTLTKSYNETITPPSLPLAIQSHQQLAACHGLTFGCFKHCQACSSQCGLVVLPFIPREAEMKWWQKMKAKGMYFFMVIKVIIHLS